MDFSVNLKKILEEKGLKQADLCRMTGIQTSLISDYLNGKKSPAISNAISIADALNISLDTLVNKESESYVEDMNKNLLENYDTYNKNLSLSNIHKKTIMKLEKMNYEQTKAVLAFINSLKEVEANLNEQMESVSEISCNNETIKETDYVQQFVAYNGNGVQTRVIDKLSPEEEKKLEEEIKKLSTPKIP